METNPYKRIQALEKGFAEMREIMLETIMLLPDSDESKALIQRFSETVNETTQKRLVDIKI